MHHVSAVILCAFAICALPLQAESDKLIAKWNEIGKTVQVIGRTGEMLFKPSIYKVELIRPCKSASDEPVHGQASLELRVIGVGDRNVLPPVTFPSDKDQLDYLIEHHFDASKSVSRFWAHELGSLELPMDFSLTKDSNNFPVGTQIDLVWKHELVLLQEAAEDEIADKPSPNPNVPHVLQADDFSSKMKVTGQLGIPLGQVCRVLGQWDSGRKREGLFFRVTEVDGCKVENASWQDFEVRDLDHMSSTLAEINRSNRRYHGKKLLLEGCEVGAFSGLPAGCPIHTPLSRPSGFHTGFVWWVREEIE